MLRDTPKPKPSVAPGNTIRIQSPRGYWKNGKDRAVLEHEFQPYVAGSTFAKSGEGGLNSTLAVIAAAVHFWHSGVRKHAQLRVGHLHHFGPREAAPKPFPAKCWCLPFACERAALNLQCPGQKVWVLVAQQKNFMLLAAWAKEAGALAWLRKSCSGYCRHAFVAAPIPLNQRIAPFAKFVLVPLCPLHSVRFVGIKPNKPRRLLREALRLYPLLERVYFPLLRTSSKPHRLARERPKSQAFALKAPILNLPWLASAYRLDRREPDLFAPLAHFKNMRVGVRLFASCVAKNNRIGAFSALEKTNKHRCAVCSASVGNDSKSRCW